ncbi:MAG: glycosyltransferase N-terminal domain-containing protein, partial [Candidatus Omnitrophota bacterium]
MQIIYDIIIFLFFLVYLPYFLFRRKINKDFFTRLGFIPQELKKCLKDKSVIWLHAVSVGELIAARSFIEELKKEFPDKILLISTVTLTANNLAKSIYTGDTVIYSPIDFSFIVKKFVRVISPCLYLCMETEIWPNIITELKKNNIPIIIINGRISDKSFRGYKKIKFILKNILNEIDIFSMQTMRDQERIINLGIDKNKVLITG